MHTHTEMYLVMWNMDFYQEQRHLIKKITFFILSVVEVSLTLYKALTLYICVYAHTSVSLGTVILTYEDISA